MAENCGQNMLEQVKTLWNKLVINIVCAFYIFGQEICILNFLRHVTQSLLSSLQNALYFIKLSFVVLKILTCYINFEVKYHCPGAMPEG